MKSVIATLTLLQAINNAPITQAAWDKYASGIGVLPPARYDIPYQGRLILTEADDMAAMPKLCNLPLAKAACTWSRKNECEIIMVPLDMLRAQNHAPRIVLRHELGHCGGWPSSHGDSRAVPQQELEDMRRLIMPTIAKKN